MTAALGISNASMAVKISPPIDESDRDSGDEQEGYSAGSSTTLTRLLLGAAAVCIDQLSYCILLLLTSTFIFQHAHTLELWQPVASSYTGSSNGGDGHQQQCQRSGENQSPH